MLCGAGDGCDTNIDTMSVAPSGTAATGFAPTEPLGGWIRGFDTATYNITPTCGPGQAGATCQAGLQPLTTRAAGRSRLAAAGRHPRRGMDRERMGPNPGRPTGTWRTATSSPTATTMPVPCRHWPGSPVRPPCSTVSVFGVWYSDYTPYSSATVEHTLYPEFVAQGVPLDTLSLDTDWKAPSSWNGWEWNSTLFPDPASFLSWAKAHGIDVTLNIHSSIDDNDPRLPTAQRIAGHTLASSSCYRRPVQGVGLELGAPGRVQLRPAAELPAPGGGVLVAGLVLRHLHGVDAWASPLTPGSTTSTPSSGPTLGSGDSSWPGSVAPMVNPSRPTRLGPGPTTRRPSPSPATPGARGTRWPRRPS